MFFFYSENQLFESFEQCNTALYEYKQFQFNQK